MKVNIISPEKLVYEGEVSLLQLPGVDGSFEILNNHAPIISVLGKGRIRLVTDSGELFFPIDNGVIECSENLIKILIQ